MGQDEPDSGRFGLPSSAAFVLTLLGVDNVAVYNGSMTEWAADPTLPLVTGQA